MHLLNFRWLSLTCFFSATLLTVLPDSAGGQVVLYDGSQGTPPGSQGWLFIASPLFTNSVMESAGPQFTTLDTTSPITDLGGYFSEDPFFGTGQHPDMPVIDPTLGFVIDFTVRIPAETHVMGPGGDDNNDGLDDRSGYSVIAIAENVRGIELGFWEGRIWAQDDDAVTPSNLFTQAEGSAFDTTSVLQPYQLRMFQDAYQLVRRDGVAPILQGRLRDYSNFSGPLDPYETPSFLFFGDNTSRGESISELAYIAVDDLPDPCQDADALVMAIVGGLNPVGFDLTDDGLVDANDLASWLAAAGEFYLGSGRSFLPGDANLDGAVDRSDFGVWNANKFTSTAAWCSGDFNADGLVDGSDFGSWNANKFQTASLANVPEPVVVNVAALLLVIISVLRPCHAARTA